MVNCAGDSPRLYHRFRVSYFFATSAKLNSIASLRSLSSWFSSCASDLPSRSPLLEAEVDVEGDTETVAPTLFGDAVPGLEGIFNGVLHALGGLPLDRWGFTGVAIPLTLLPRDETLSPTAGNSLSSERSELVDIDRAIPGDPDDPAIPADQASGFARGEVWILTFDEDGRGRDWVKDGGVGEFSEGSRRSSSSRLSISTYSKASCSFNPNTSNEPS